MSEQAKTRAGWWYGLTGLLIALAGVVAWWVTTMFNSVPGGGVAAPTSNPPQASTAGATDLPDWPMYRRTADMAGRAEESLDLPLRLIWRFQTDRPVVSSPVVADGVVYVGSNDGQLRAIDLPTGQLLWAYRTGDRSNPAAVEAPPLVGDDLVYVGSSDQRMHAVDKQTGQVAWTFATQGQVLGAANIMEWTDGRRRLYFGSYDSHLYCVDASTGKLIWKHKTGSYVNGAPALAAGRIAVGGCDGLIYLIDANTGTVLAEQDVGAPIAATGALVDQQIFIGHYGNAFVCASAEDLAIQWVYDTVDRPFFGPPAVGKRAVLFGGRDRALHCVDRATGQPQWTFATRGNVDSGPVIAGDQVVFGSDDGLLRIVSLDDGRLLWSYELGEAIVSSPAVVGPWVVVGCDDGAVYAFGGAAGP
jgi:outer membrane protein assembly factor BamB